MHDQTVSQADAAAVVTPEGDLVAARLPALRARLREIVGAGVLNLTLDLKAVEAVDSTGIGLLIAAHNSLKKAGGKLMVVHASADILELFRTMRIHQHFSVSGS